MEEKAISISDISPEILSSAVYQRMVAIPTDLRRLPEKTLRNKLKPSIEQVQLKNQFHEEMKRAKNSKKKMVMKRVFANIYKKDFFYENVLYDHLLLAWVTTPVIDLELKIQAALSLVTDRFEELVSMDINTTKNVKVDGVWTAVSEVCPKKASVLVSVIKLLSDRHMGLAIQKQVTLNVNEPSTLEGEQAELDMDKVNTRLKELEEKLGETRVTILPDID